jgi:hypothetical protein
MQGSCAGGRYPGVKKPSDTGKGSRFGENFSRTDEGGISAMEGPGSTDDPKELQGKSKSKLVRTQLTTVTINAI